MIPRSLSPIRLCIFWTIGSTPIEAAVRERARGFIQTMIAGSPVRPPVAIANGHLQIDVPRARLNGPAGKTTEWNSQVLRACERRTLAADALIASTYLAGTNTRRVRRALKALFGGAVGKDTGDELRIVCLPTNALLAPRAAAVRPCYRAHWTMSVIRCQVL
jgi:hypothetical protein